MSSFSKIYNDIYKKSFTNKVTELSQAVSIIQSTGSDGVSNSDVSLTAKDLYIIDNVITLNSNETGNGITKTERVGGIEIHRGKLPNYRLIYDDTDYFLKAGLINSLEKIAIVDKKNEVTGLLRWNGRRLTSLGGLSDSTINRFNRINQELSTNDSPTFNKVTITSGYLQTYNINLKFPTNTGSTGNLLSTDGNGNLRWVSGSLGSSGASANLLTNTSGGSTVEIPLNEESINITSNFVPVSTLNSESVNFYVPTNIQSSLNVEGDVTLNNFVVNGTGTFHEDVSFGKEVTFDSNVSFKDEVVFDQKVYFNQPIAFQGGIKYSVTSITSQMYTITDEDDSIVINWKGDDTLPETETGEIHLPPSVDNPGRILIIQNKCSNGKRLKVFTYETDTIDGGYDPEGIELSEKFEHIKLVSDGEENWIITT